MLPQCLMTRSKLSIRVYWAASINTTLRYDFVLTEVPGQSRQTRAVTCASYSERNHLDVVIGC
jgi:hypothetical protein